MPPLRRRAIGAAALSTLASPGQSGEGPQQPPRRDVTFLSTSDAHYCELERKAQNERNHATIVEMNQVAKVAWPEKLGGDTIHPPRGVVMLGDCIDDGDRVINGKKVTPEQYQAFVADFGLDGTVGDRLRLAYRCKEGVKITRQPDKSEAYAWGGQWGWRWMLDRNLAAPSPTQP